jgi:hypothetical protein
MPIMGDRMATLIAVLAVTVVYKQKLHKQNGRREEMMNRGAVFVLSSLLLISLFSVITVVPKAYSSGAPETEWTKTYGGPDDDSGSSVISTSDGGYAILGSITDLVFTRVMLIKTDAYGNQQWNKTYGQLNDHTGCIVQTSDGGYAILATTQASGEDRHDADVRLIKTDANGTQQWTKKYGGTDEDRGTCLLQTSDGGYAIAGKVYIYGEPTKAWLTKTNAEGTQQWSRIYGGIYDDCFESLVQTPDGGYVLTGCSETGPILGDIWLVKTDAYGNQQWSQTYVVEDGSEGHSLVQTSDGGYAILGITFSYGAGSQDYWLIKTDANGNSQWNKTYGGAGAEYGYSLVATSDGGYALAGFTTSYIWGKPEVWLIKTDDNGNAEWTGRYGGAGNVYDACVIQADDGGYLVLSTIGNTTSWGDEGTDWFLVKVGSAVIPEFPSWVFLSLLLTTTFLVVICKRKLTRTERQQSY